MTSQLPSIGSLIPVGELTPNQNIGEIHLPLDREMKLVLSGSGLSVVLPIGTTDISPSLARLFQAAGTTGGTVAGQVGVDPVLFERVDARRQALPDAVAGDVAALLGVTLYDVRACCRRLTLDSTTAARTPLPPDPVLGDKLNLQALLPTSQVVPLGAPSLVTPQIWVAKQSPSPNVQQLDRNTGAVLKLLALSDVRAPTQFAFDPNDKKLWTFSATAAGGDYYVARVDPSTAPPTLDFEVTDVAFSAPRRSAYEPVSRTLWASNGGGAGLLVKVSTDTGLSLGTLQLNDGANNFSAFEMAVPGDGFLYAIGNRGASVEARLFRVEPVGATVDATSTGTNMLGVTGLCYDADEDAFFAVRTAGVLYRVERGTMVGSTVTVTGGTLAAPEFIAAGGGYLWVVDVVAGDVYLKKLTPAGAIEGELRLSNGTAGPVMFDGVYPWAIATSDGSVHKANPNDDSDSMVEVSVLVPGGVAAVVF